MKFQGKIHYLFGSFRSYLIYHRKAVNTVFKFILGLIGIASVLPLISDTWRQESKEIINKVIKNFPEFARHFYDPRSFVFYIIILLMWLTLVYYKFEVLFLRLALENKRRIAEDLPVIRRSGPKNHTIFFLLGRLEESSLKLIMRRGPEIISAIDKNIKKHEQVYWISGNEIGIFFYEATDRPKENIVEFVINRKLFLEIGQDDAKLFVDNLKYAIVEVDPSDDLYILENKARTELVRTELEKSKRPGATNSVEDKG
jgi:hypothetical protein